MPKLAQMHKTAKKNTKVGTPGTILREIWNLIQGAAVVLPRLAEANVGDEDGAPDEEIRNTGQGQKPVEELCPGVRCLVDIGQQSECQLDDDAPERTAFLIDVGEEPRGHATCGKSLHCPRAAKCAGVRDREHGNGDDEIEYGGKHFDASRLE